MKNFIYNNKPQDLCYGCRACEQICPHSAVHMIVNEEGFIYPEIDSTKCINCGLCEKVCPTQDVNKERILHGVPTECYAAWNNNIEERLQSTSGGLFFLLASYVIEHGGVVYGCTMNNDLMAQHIRVSSLEDLNSLRGSKYMQSDTLATFSQVKSDLKKGYNVLYSGTPCQIAGLRSFLMADYNNLYTIDLVCHGTPSPIVFKEHLNYLSNKYKSNVTSFFFRAKKKSGWRSYVKYSFENGKIIYKRAGEDFYFCGFCEGWFNRSSCFLCEYSQTKRVGDITLSDFWGGERFIKKLQKQRKYGYNLVICNTERGKQLFDLIKKKIGLIKCNFMIAQKGDIRLRQAEARPSFRDSVYSLIKECGYESVVNQYQYKPSIIQKCVPNFVINLIKELKSRI